MTPVITDPNLRKQARAVYGAPNRTCRHCDETKPIELFKKAKYCIDGHSHQCRRCANQNRKALAFGKGSSQNCNLITA